MGLLSKIGSKIFGKLLGGGAKRLGKKAISSGLKKLGTKALKDSAKSLGKKAITAGTNAGKKKLEEVGTQVLNDVGEKIINKAKGVSKSRQIQKIKNQVKQGVKLVEDGSLKQLSRNDDGLDDNVRNMIELGKQMGWSKSTIQRKIMRSSGYY